MGNLDVELEPNKNRVKTELDQARDTLRNAAWLGTDEEREQIEKAVELLCGEPCEDAISRQEVLDFAVKIELPDSQTFFCISPEDVEALPPVSPQPKTGHWIDEGYYADGSNASSYRCSVCGEHIIEYEPDRYCKFCGAKMVGSQESEEHI